MGARLHTLRRCEWIRCNASCRPAVRHDALLLVLPEVAPSLRLVTLVAQSLHVLVRVLAAVDESDYVVELRPCPHDPALEARSAQWLLLPLALASGLQSAATDALVSAQIRSPIQAPQRKSPHGCGPVVG